MSEIKFDLGKNIVETARNSGVPKFQAGNTAGLIDYSINQIPADIPARFTRPGYEISVAPLFAFTMNADEDNKNNLAVTTVTLQVENHDIKTHEAGRQLVDKLLAQFKKGKWRRHIRRNCPLVTGRSSILNVDGDLDIGTCSRDPDYPLTNDEWIRMIKETQYYEWIGDGVLAELSVRYSTDAQGITYEIFVEFADLAAKEKIESKNYAESLKDGDAKGWNTSVKSAQRAKETEARNKILEANAINRGDRVLQR